jgi:hypothetical protein
MPHEDAAGADLDEISLLIRISIDSIDPGQATQQRGRLTRLTQKHDLHEVVIVSPGWELMLLRIQRAMELEMKNNKAESDHLTTLGPKVLAYNLFRMLCMGDSLGFGPLETNRRALRKFKRFDTIMKRSGLQLGSTASIIYTRAAAGNLIGGIIRHSPFAIIPFDEAHPRRYGNRIKSIRNCCSLRDTSLLNSRAADVVNNDIHNLLLGAQDFCNTFFGN